MIPSVILIQLVGLAHNWDALKMGARERSSEGSTLWLVHDYVTGSHPWSFIRYISADEMWDSVGKKCPPGQ
jgi:hypothetical protein